MTKKQAEDYLYNLWKNGKVPANFTESHSEYGRAVNCLMKLGHLVWDDFF